jgi:hypothetical protein
MISQIRSARLKTGNYAALPKKLEMQVEPLSFPFCSGPHQTTGVFQFEYHPVLQDDRLWRGKHPTHYFMDERIILARLQSISDGLPFPTNHNASLSTVASQVAVSS